MGEPYEEYIEVGLVGHISTKATSYDGLTDDEAEELRQELDERAARRIPAGFRATSERRARSGGRIAGTFPRVPHFDKRGATHPC